jgi:hypothetical protein
MRGRRGQRLTRATRPRGGAFGHATATTGPVRIWSVGGVARVGRARRRPRRIDGGADQGNALPCAPLFGRGLAVRPRGFPYAFRRAAELAPGAQLGPPDGRATGREARSIGRVAVDHGPIQLRRARTRALPRRDVERFEPAKSGFGREGPKQLGHELAREGARVLWGDPGEGTRQARQWEQPATGATVLRVGERPAWGVAGAGRNHFEAIPFEVARKGSGAGFEEPRFGESTRARTRHHASATSTAPTRTRASPTRPGADGSQGTTASRAIGGGGRPGTRATAATGRPLGAETASKWFRPKRCAPLSGGRFTSEVVCVENPPYPPRSARSTSRGGYRFESKRLEALRSGFKRAPFR